MPGWRPDQGVHVVALGNVQALEGKITAFIQDGKARFLQAHVVIVVYVVDADDTLALGQKGATRMKPDKPGGHR